MQGVLSRAIFRCPPVSGPNYFTVLSLHINNIYAKKKGIAKKLIFTLRAIMISQQVDLVAGDFNGTAWRCSNRDNISTIDEAFADCTLPTPDLDQFQTTGQTFVDSLSHQVLIVIGNCISTVHSSFHGKRLA